MRPIILTLLFGAFLQAQTASIQGTVTDAASHQPMARVHLIFRPANPKRQTDIYGAVSRDDGSFSVADLAPGTYGIEARYNGYLPIPATATLTAGEERKDLIVQMTQRAVITGHVLDENGDAAPRTPVSATPLTGQGSSQTTTDERGFYRLPLDPGQYRLHALAQNVGRAQSLGSQEIRLDGTVRPVYGDTFYPSVIELSPGQNTNVDIHLTPHVSRSISGIVTGLPEGKPDVPRAFVNLYRASSPNSFTQLESAAVGEDGKFSFANIAPGHYSISAVGNGAPLRSAVIELPGENDSFSNLTIALAYGETLRGKLRIEGRGPAAMDVRKMAIRLEPNPGESRIDADGKFQINSVFPGKFILQLTGLPENAFVKTVRIGNVEWHTGRIDLPDGVKGAQMDVLVSPNAGQLEGTVANEEGQATSDKPFVWVVLAGEDDDLNVKQVDSGTKFRFTGLHPGKYRLVVVDPRHFREGDRAALESLLAKAPEIEIHEGDRISQDLKATVPEDSHAK